jgi:hypothetical protein
MVLHVLQESMPRSEYLAAIKEFECKGRAETSEIDAKIVMLEKDLTRTEKAVALAAAEFVNVLAKIRSMVPSSELQIWIDKSEAAKAQAKLVSTEQEKHILYLSDQLQMRSSEIGMLNMAMEVSADFGSFCSCMNNSI